MGTSNLVNDMNEFLRTNLISKLKKQVAWVAVLTVLFAIFVLILIVNNKSNCINKFISGMVGIMRYFIAVFQNALLNQK